MGMGFRCMFGFSVNYTNTFSEHLERRCADTERHFRLGNLELMNALVTLHDAVDAGLAGQPAEEPLARGLAELACSSDHLTAIGEALVRTRAELFERAGADAGDPLVARDPYFRHIDYEELHSELAAHGAALPQRALWDELATRMRDGGTRGGLRLLDRHVRELQSDLRSFMGEIEVLRAQPLAQMAKGVHTLSMASAAPLIGYCRLLTAVTYFSLACERASQLYESSQQWTERVAAAS